MNWIDVTDKYAKTSEKSYDERCDWASGCGGKVRFRVTLHDGHQRFLCKFHLQQRLEACNYTHIKVEELEELENEKSNNQW
jgi:hypothetical protein